MHGHLRKVREDLAAGRADGTKLRIIITTFCTSSISAHFRHQPLLNQHGLASSYLTAVNQQLIHRTQTFDLRMLSAENGGKNDGDRSMSTTETKRVEKRISARAKASRMLHVRPSEADVEHFEEITPSSNVSKHGIYFHSHRRTYRMGMRLFITYPFTFENDPMKAEYLAEVVRVDQLEDNRFGVAVRLLMTV
jgi:hypothetical protein